MAFRSLLACLALVAALASGCADSGGGSASVYVKDAPTDMFDEIHVVFTEVAVHAAGSGDGEDGDDADGNGTAGNETDKGAGGAGWRVLFSSASGVDVDLLNATGAQAAFLGEADLEAGRYTQLRITVEEAYGMANGTKVLLALSSGTLKLNHPFTVAAGAETRLVLDFDLDGSLHQQGNGAWRMTPVVGSVSADEVDDASSGDEAAQPGDVEDLDA